MIQVENHTPFPAIAFEKHGRLGYVFDVIAFRMTFRLKNGYYADLADEQAELVMADEYYGEPETSSLKYETDLVLYKRNADIHVIGSACPPGGSGTQWMAGIRVGDFSKRLMLSGPRCWRFENHRWRQGQPESIASVPLRYELAYGGVWQASGRQEYKQTFFDNPLGCGYYPDIRHLDTTQEYSAPQLTRFSQANEEISLDIDTICTPQGTGPMSRWWQSRLQYAGTYDDNWRENCRPSFPDDFSERFYNSAHPELIYPSHLSGNEPIVLEGLLPEASRIVTGLPGYQPVCVLTDIHNRLHTQLPVADTLTINLDERLIYITYRLTVPVALHMKEAVLGCLVPPRTKGACRG
ncbi:DUF2169 domain-containing protein [Hafnia paralvei]|jgi:hypothetical protein|uniref:DUF2169 family type VI secretion system accessory protein n=1 Tax=Hafnia paralvei TaxID=546367 RepID=UPI000DF1480F|nr:DUF2169 domain-containing protein [Hafnia paralvei]RDA69981.1 DUF2169 domain-containing protein [Hafnia paralvei]RDA70809.1 DUF2169 domain-containing protein [Hafnia paralvei]RDA71574.1 DUF2169 domain-containing protein [Hafnia paralvei]RDA80244.1 DUF2169 domain-containing protein [Hafnia paralvei]RDA80592.1 DUF2169 domain-containing protein [Hafnia paralvei]